MISIRRDPEASGHAAVLEALAHRRRRSVLRVVAASDSVHVEDLVGTVATSGRGPTAGPARTRERVRIELYHRHLPKLAEAELVRWSGRQVEAARRLQEDALLRDLLAVEVDDWNGVLEALSEPLRRTALAHLAEADEPVDVPALAFRVAEERGGAGRTDVDALVREFHHVHLPKLERAGLVAVEAGGTAVRYLGHPDLEDVARENEGTERDRPELAN